MKNIFPLKVINKLIVDEKDLNTSKDKVKYLEDCFNDINDSMIAHFNHGSDQYLFHRAFYIDDTQGFVSIKFPESNPMHPYIVAHIQAIEKDIRNNVLATSFTELLNTQKKLGLCLYHPKKSDHGLPNLDNILCFNLDKDPVRRVEEFFATEEGYLNKLVAQYRAISENFNSESSIYIYFIRPFTDQPHYNGTFNLILKRPLTEAEFVELGFIWTKILSDTAIVEGKEEEQKLVFREHTHTWSTKLRALSQSVNEIKEHFDFLPPHKFTNRINEAVFIAESDIDELRNVNDFNLMMMKIGDLREFIKQQQEFPALLTVEKINLNELLVKVVDTQSRNLEFWNEESSAPKLKLLQDLSAKLKATAPIEITAFKTPLSIIFNDLLKNAIVHTLYDPVIDIEIIRLSPKSVTIKFSNNIPLEENAMAFINDDKFDPKIFLARRFGIRTIKRIINSQIFKLNNIQADLYADPASINGPTVIRLTITYT